jgi:hypothetical protein
MAFEVHTVESPVGSNRNAVGDRKIIGQLIGVANQAGSGAGASVTTAISGLRLPANYGVWITPNQDADCYVTSKTAAGFNVVMNPRLAANTLAAGTFDVLIVA